MIGASIAILAIVAQPRAWSEQTAPATAEKQKDQEESVLVATRELPEGSTSSTPTTDSAAKGESLEPIAQSSDSTPDLANENKEQDESSQFGEALEQVAQPPKAEEPAAETANADAPAGETASPVAPSVSGVERRAEAARAEKIPFEPVKFQGILVGKSTKAELITAWGEPVESINTAEGDVLVYHKSPFQAVEVLIGTGDIVSTIKIALATPLEAKKLAEQLSLSQIEPVIALDDAEQPLGEAFPERGVLFMFVTSESIAPVSDDVSSMKVSHVVLQPLDPLAFTLRAENHLHGPYTQNICDLKYAIAIDPEMADAYCLLAKIYLATGQADLAAAAAADACDIDAKCPRYQLCHAETRVMLGDYDEAVRLVRAVLDRSDLAPLDRAQALFQMAQLATLGDGEIAAKAIPFATRAIEIADTLANSKDRKERRAAKQLLIEAHVAIAEDIARQPFNEKVESLSMWIGRASGIAEDYIANDRGSVALRLYIAEHVLAGLASFKPTLDPAPWVTEAEEAAKELFAMSDDELWQHHVKWELGTAYLNALRIEHTRRQTDNATKFGELAIENLAVGASTRQAVHSSEQLVGQLYFQMGAIYAVHKLDHAKAIEWYDKAAPLLSGGRPESELYAPRREGEMLVSMGVSYWQHGDKTRALDLTQNGVKLVETAVDGGVLAKTTLAVPYGNLATMYQQMGESSNATKYAQLAKSVGGNVEEASADGKSTTKQPPHIGRRKGRRNRAH
jgi:tetratricopeptide (TPR) repeat protein